MLEDILIPIFAMTTTFGTIFGIAYIFFMTRHRERISMIEKGFDPKMFQTEKKRSNSALKYGLLLFGIGIGICVGYALEAFAHWNSEASYFSGILTFGGLGLLAYYLIDLKMSKKEELDMSRTGD
jgi:hypothetical protein